MRRLICGTALLILPCLLHAQFGSDLFDRLYNRIESLHSDGSAESSMLSPASIFEKPGSGVCISTARPFLLEDLQTTTVSAYLNSGNGMFSGGLANSGHGRLKVLDARLGYALQMKGASVGIQFGCTAASYLSASPNVYSAAIAATCALMKRLRILGGLKFSERPRSRMSQPIFGIQVSSGIGLQLSDELFLGGSFIKNSDVPADGSLGLLYHFVKAARARLGISTSTSSYYVGAGYELGNWSLDACVTIRSSIGISPSLSLTWKKQKL